MALFFHVDMDAFYASVEQADNPQWQGRPVIVGAMPGKRGVVAACSYEARTFGVRSAQSSAKAYQLCPQAIYVMPNMKRYIEVSRQIMEILGRFTAHLEKLSIDEAWLDLSSHPEALRDPYAYGQKIKQAIKEETSLNITVGMASNRFLAKICSQENKPNGLFWLRDDAVLDYLLKLDLSSLWGIGYKTRQLLNKRAIFTIEQLRSCTLKYLQQHFGQKLGEVLYNSCRGIDPVDRRHQIKNRSIGNETTFADDEFDEQTILNHLLWLSHKTFNRMLDAGYESQTVAVKIRSSNFETQQIQKTFDSAITSVEQLYAYVKELFFIRWQNRQALRLVGVSLCNLERCRQLSLFNEQGEKQRQIEQIMQKFKKQGVLVAKASLLSYEKDWQKRQAGERPVFDGLLQSLNDPG